MTTNENGVRQSARLHEEDDDDDDDVMRLNGERESERGG